jgi:hypothetical protein
MWIVCAVDLAHASQTNGAHEFVTPKLCSRCKWHVTSQPVSRDPECITAGLSQCMCSTFPKQFLMLGSHCRFCQDWPKQAANVVAKECSAELFDRIRSQRRATLCHPLRPRSIPVTSFPRFCLLMEVSIE